MYSCDCTKTEKSIASTWKQFISKTALSQRQVLV